MDHTATLLAQIAAVLGISNADFLGDENSASSNQARELHRAYATIADNEPCSVSNKLVLGEVLAGKSPAHPAVFDESRQTRSVLLFFPQKKTST